MKFKNEIIKIGKFLFQEGLNHSHSGNLSIRNNNKVYITKTGSMLFDLTRDDIVSGDINENHIKNASMEYIVHRAIYLNNTYAKAIVHCHPIFTTALSFHFDEIKPIDAEGIFYFKKVPVLKVENAIASSEVAQKIPNYFNNSKIVIVKGHGVFSIGKTLEEAYKYVSSLEASCKILYYSKN